MKSITLSGVSSTAEAQTLLDVSGAIGAVISYPVLETYRVDERLIVAGE